MKHGTCFGTFGVCCFQDGGLQQIALSDKERAVPDKQRPHNKTGKATSAEMVHRQGVSGKNKVNKVLVEGSNGGYYG